MMLDLQLSPETRTLVDALKGVSIGAEVSYRALSDAIGRDVTGPGRGSLNSARRIAIRDHGAAFMVVRSQGLRRVPPEEAAQIGAGARRKVRRTAYRALRDMRCLVEASNGLSPEAQRKVSAEVSALGLLREISTDRQTEKMETEGKPMPAAIAAKSFLDAIS